MSPTFNLLLYLLGKTKWSTSFPAGAMTSSFPAMGAPAHLHVHQTKDPDASSPTAFPFPPPSSRAEPPNNLKNREKLVWELKEDAENTEALLSLSVVSWAVANFWLGFAGAIGGKILESPCSLPQAGSAAQGEGDGDRSPQPFKECPVWSRTSLWPSDIQEHLWASELQCRPFPTKIILLKQIECSSLYSL